MQTLSSATPETPETRNEVTYTSLVEGTSPCLLGWPPIFPWHDNFCFLVCHTNTVHRLVFGTYIIWIWIGKNKMVSNLVNLHLLGFPIIYPISWNKLSVLKIVVSLGCCSWDSALALKQIGTHSTCTSLVPRPSSKKERSVVCSVEGGSGDETILALDYSVHDRYYIWLLCNNY